jgi:hypothetical protein
MECTRLLEWSLICYDNNDATDMPSYTMLFTLLCHLKPPAVVSKVMRIVDEATMDQGNLTLVCYNEPRELLVLERYCDSNNERLTECWCWSDQFCSCPEYASLTQQQQRRRGGRLDRRSDAVYDTKHACVHLIAIQLLLALDRFYHSRLKPSMAVRLERRQQAASMLELIKMFNSIY